MATFASFLSCSPHPPPPSLYLRCRILPPSASLLAFNPTGNSGKLRLSGIRVFASSASSSSSDWISSVGDENSGSKKSVLFDLIRDIEPLDVSLIQKDVSNTTVDAMKRTISGMLGLLPSDQFQVMIDALWESLSKLLISSMMTGYTLRNAEYRLSLERNLEIYEGNTYNLTNGDSKCDAEAHLNEESFAQESSSSSNESEGSIFNIQGFGEMTPEARRYILTLHSRISLVKKGHNLKPNREINDDSVSAATDRLELHEVKRKSAALQMQQFVGEEKNDLLDYLRSLQPEKVLELSEPTSAELKETIHSVVHGLLATLSPKMQSKSPDPESDLDNIIIASVDNSEEEQEDEVEAGDYIDTSLHFHPLVSLPRDYLARLLFWCMLLGHYLRGLEYRLELMNLLSLPSLPETEDSGGHHSV